MIHFAGFKAVGESVDNPLMYYQNNVARTINLLQLMEKYDCNSIIFSSSCTVFGDGGTNDENGALGPISPYGRTKYMVEQILQDASAANKKLTTICLRYYNPIGAHPSGLIGESPLDIPNNLMPFVLRVALK